MSGHRQAAVALHAIGETDRGLILAELPAADQATLRAYLEELKELGFDGEEAGDLLHVAALPVAAATTLERIAAASPSAMFAILEHEPASLIAQFLALHDWPWAPGMLDLFPAARRERIRTTCPSSAQAAPARQRFLLDAMLARLDDAGQPPMAHPASALAPLLRMVKSWTR